MDKKSENSSQDKSFCFDATVYVVEPQDSDGRFIGVAWAHNIPTMVTFRARKKYFLERGEQIKVTGFFVPSSVYLTGIVESLIKTGRFSYIYSSGSDISEFFRKVYDYPAEI